MPANPSSRWILTATILGSSMAFIDGTAVNTALPIMQLELHASLAVMQWVVAAYMVFLSSLMLVGGALGDRLGRRRIYMLGVAIFTLASMGCGLAPDATVLVSARALQGIGAALLVPGSLAIITATYGPEERGRAIGTWSGATAITTALGQVLGGVLAQYVSWRAIFFVNVPLAIAVLLLSWREMPPLRSGAEIPLDWLGATLATFALGALTFGLIESSTLGFADPRVAGSLLAGGLALGAFIVAEKRLKHPMLPLGLFRAGNFAGANVLTLLLYGALSGTLFFLPFDLIQVQGYSASLAGLALLPFVVLMSLLSRWSGGLITRYGARMPLVVGPAVVAIAFALFARPGVSGSYWLGFFPAITLLGLGMAVTVAPLTTVVMSAPGPENAGVASGVNNAVARLAGLLAIAVMGVLLVTVFGHALDTRLAALPLPETARALLAQNRDRLAALPVPGGLPAATREAAKAAIQASYVTGFRCICLLNAALAVASAVMAATLIRAPKRDK